MGVRCCINSMETSVISHKKNLMTEMECIFARLWSAVALVLVLGVCGPLALELVSPAVSPELQHTQLSDPHVVSKRSVQQIPLGTAGFPLPVDIDPIPSGPRVTMPHISFRDMGVQVDAATATVKERFDTIEPAIYNNGVRQIPGTPAWYMAASHKTKVVAKNISRIALIAEEATKYMAQEFKLDKDQISYGLPTADVRGTILGDQCPVEVDFPCQPRKYRAFNGYCNNVQNPKWGNANTRYLRFLPADYGDGVSVPRQSAQGEFLPSSRIVSLTVHGDHSNAHKYMTALAATLGEFVFHDLFHTPQMAGYVGQRLRCCNVQFNDFHPECYPIRLPENDPVYSRVQEKCQEYVRSGTAPRTGCTLGPREQINQVSGFLDGSVIYGSSKAESDELRSFKRGQLAVQRGPQGTQLLPADENQVDCRSSSKKHRCFKSGDVRVNEHVGLAAMHQLFMREHNRVADALHKLNTHWNDEQIFQEARRIVGAELQHVVYTEFLPAILGQTVVEKYGLNPQSSGFFTGYDININAGVANSVGSAALAFIMSMMPNTVEYYSGGRKVSDRSITETFYSPFDLYERGKFDEILEGLVHSHAQNEDPAIADAISNRLFMDENGIGIDRVATIIQQGRDHGIASYNAWRGFCGLKKAKGFEDLEDVIPPATIDALKRVYQSVEDIDLFTGGLSEKPNRGAVVGPTFGCLIGRQFHYLRRGDRYWYENDIPPSAITKEQLYEVRKTSLARIICDNSDNIQYIQPKALIQADPFLNAEMSCAGKNIPSINLRKWKTASPNFVVPDEMLQESIERAKRDIGSMRDSEWNLWENRKSADPQGASGSAYAFNRPKNQAIKISNTSFILQFASARFVNNFIQGNERLRTTRNIDSQLKDIESGSVSPNSINDLMDVLPNIDVSDIMEIPNIFECDDQTLPCDHTSRFRTATGWCNNLKNPGLGKSFRAQARLLRPSYEDGLSTPRAFSVTKKPLPTARLISTNIHSDVSAPHVRYTLMIMQWGQLIDHDLIFTPVNKGFQDSILDCRQCDSPQVTHPECFPIHVPPNDPFFPPVNISTGKPFCLPLTRSMPGQLTLGYREQINQVTSYLDASHTYGSDKCEQRKLRVFKDGHLVWTENPIRGKPFLPTNPENHECKAASRLCFTGGDTRAAEQPALAAIHTLFLREHNRVADELKKHNKHWTDEALFQQTRRIVTAINQHITFNEWLPRVLGWNAINLYELNLLPEGYYEGYDSKCDATILNEIGIVFRFGHTLLKPAFERMDGIFAKRDPPVKLSDHFFNTDLLFEPGMLDEIMRGLTTVPIETFDQFLTDEVTNHLFEEKEHKFSGFDLASLNIQRGRDHGLQPYNEYRVLCNLTRARTFDDLSREVAKPIIERLKRIYDHVDDIDLFTGGLIETPLHGGLIGPTFGCIMGIQFRNLRKCDRFWYENSDPLVRFTDSQLTEIRKVTLSRLLCDNCETVDSEQRSGFDLPDPFLNPRVSCRDMPAMNLELWKERVSCSVGTTNIEIGAADRISPCVMCTCTKEGPICQSLKVDNCFHLAKSYSPEAILNDHVCKVQCTFAFRAFPEVGARDNNKLGFFNR
ncbi:Heme binding peroxidase-1 [Hyalella azteca]|uniref:Heme binding peroxidase-1 n=1 Tax=Hyalella azteca TaxID=294128 RepID=A0A6A0GZC5_HYAAZ|nr:Heme binding peroxidase-1 [Hyalella azteca]